MKALAKFYSQTLSLNNITVLRVVDRDVLFTQYMIYKVFFIKDKLKWENMQQSALTKTKKQS